MMLEAILRKHSWVGKYRWIRKSCLVLRERVGKSAWTVVDSVLRQPWSCDKFFASTFDILTSNWPVTVTSIEPSCGFAGWASTVATRCWTRWKGRLCWKKRTLDIPRRSSILTHSFSTMVFTPWNCCPSNESILTSFCVWGYFRIKVIRNIASYVEWD